jgi:hypothetical protein
MSSPVSQNHRAHSAINKRYSRKDRLKELSLRSDERVYVKPTLHKKETVGAECGAFGVGTVFKVTAAGAETLLYSFRGAADGAHPEAGMT